MSSAAPSLALDWRDTDAKLQEGLLKFDLALAVDGVFDHRRMSVERLVTEATSRGVIAPARAETSEPKRH